MCGIAGFIAKKRNSDILNQMGQKIAHRGPDGSGNEIFEKKNWNIHLTHRRLSIIDLELGQQPFCSTNTRLIFNGEIFNFLDLKKDLINKNQTFQTQSDTEVLLKAYETQGIDAFKTFNGMFAFALYDLKEEALILARDSVGIKPLYYSIFSDGGMAFSSELDSLMVHPQTNKKISNSALHSFFYLDYVHAPASMIEGVYKLEPGHYLKWHNGKIHGPQRFSDPINLKRKIKKQTKHFYLNKLDELLEQSVQQQLIADVDVGVFLSGGIDSSLVCAYASRFKKNINTFSIEFLEKDFDESHFAKMVADNCHTTHWVRSIGLAELESRCFEILKTLDEPLADPSYLPTYILSEFAAQKVKVVLGGDGGDELFAGYPTYQAHQFRPLFDPILNIKFIHQALGQTLNLFKASDRYQSLEWKLKRLFLRYQSDPILGHLSWMASTPNLKGNQEFLTKLYQQLQDGFNRENKNSLLMLDFKTYLPGSVLAKVDRASMRNSLEVRPPFLDLPLIFFAFEEIDFQNKLHYFEAKYLLKELMKQKLPPEILKRKKQGFAIPLNRWIHTSLQKKIKVILAQSPIWDLTDLDQSYFVKANQSHLARSHDYSKTLWQLIVLDTWLKHKF